MKQVLRSLPRRKALKYLAIGSAGLSLPTISFGMSEKIMKRTIASSGEKIGIVGLGTWQTFDVGSSEAGRTPLREVLRVLVENGGNLVDSSPMYGSSEKVVGDLTHELDIEDPIFYATKVWTSGEGRGKSQMESSMKKMGANPMDLMQIHNLQDWRTHIKTLYDWKERGIVKHIGITHYVDSAHDQLERIIKSEKLDFVQMNYSIGSRNAERSLLPAALDNGVAVLTNVPYGGGSLFRKVKGKELPEWSKEFGCQSWGQFFLKYLLSNPAVTCVIPGTSKPHHMKDNMAAGLGRLPSDLQRKKMVDFMNTL
ncbi:MAG: aldo/keto reductase [Cyclobacteriaceae bacterium]